MDNKLMQLFGVFGRCVVAHCRAELLPQRRRLDVCSWCDRAFLDLSRETADPEVARLCFGTEGEMAPRLDLFFSASGAACDPLSISEGSVGERLQVVEGFIDCFHPRTKLRPSPQCEKRRAVIGRVCRVFFCKASPCIAHQHQRRGASQRTGMGWSQRDERNVCDGRRYGGGMSPHECGGIFYIS